MAHIIEHANNPALGQFLAAMRSIDLQNDRHRFRENMKIIGALTAYEIAQTLPSREECVRTPLGERSVRVLDGHPILGTALRAGVPFLNGMLEIFRDSDAMFFGASRDDDAGGPEADLTMKIKLSYQAVSPCHERTVIFADPMVATGSTVVDIYNSLLTQGIKPDRFIVAGLVGFAGAIERLEVEIPGCEVWFATCDDDLDERGYIIPGLGDAGDLCFGQKL